MKKTKFDDQANQQQDQGKIIDDWHKNWQNKITRDPHQPHNLDNAVKELKEALMGNQDQQNQDQDQKNINADDILK